MWLINSSIGRKFIMALTGICLVLFITFHALMNAVAILWPTAYNQVCMFLGANWYALVASAGLGLLVVIHIIYALCLTVQNRKARGNNRYAVSKRPATVEWSSQNMLVLGIIVLAFLGVHLVQFWAKMQAQEVMGQWYSSEGALIPAAAGTLFIQFAFEQWWTPVVYIIGFVALWFHLNHGFWSMWQSIGWDNAKWLPRLKCIGNWWVSIVILLFIAQAVTFTVRANQNYYLNDAALLNQYREMYIERSTELQNESNGELIKLQQERLAGVSDEELNSKAMDIQIVAQEGQKVLGDSFEKLMTLSMERQQKAEAIAEEEISVEVVNTNVVAPEEESEDDDMTPNETPNTNE